MSLRTLQRRARRGGRDGHTLPLSGLPSDLTASILAHEATHAWWIELHPNFPYADALPLGVEEGRLCRLVAHLFLHEGLDPAEVLERTQEAAPRRMTIPTTRSNERSRQYFRFFVETDDGVACTARGS